MLSSMDSEPDRCDGAADAPDGQPALQPLRHLYPPLTEVGLPRTFQFASPIPFLSPGQKDGVVVSLTCLSLFLATLPRLQGSLVSRSHLTHLRSVPFFSLSDPGADPPP